MADRIKKTIAASAAIGALAVGGSALAQAGSGSGDQGPPVASQVSEAAEANEAPEANEQPGSDVPNDDGPNGHADEPENPNADHQFEGKE